jgi:DNA-binding NtrC family response regulator
MRWRDIERMVFANTLAKTGTIRAAAEALGIAKSTLADRVRALRIPVPRRSRRVREERPWKEESSALTEMW